MEMRSRNPVWPQDAQQEIGSRLHWQVRSIQPVILVPVGILWPNRVLILGEIILQIFFAEENSWFHSLAGKNRAPFITTNVQKNAAKFMIVRGVENLGNIAKMSCWHTCTCGT